MINAATIALFAVGGLIGLYYWVGWCQKHYPDEDKIDTTKNNAKDSNNDITT